MSPNLDLDLSLRFPSLRPPLPPQYSQPPTSTLPSQITNEESEAITRPNNETSNNQQQQRRRRRTRADMTRIEPPYPWSTDRRAVVHELKYLQVNNIMTIKGEVICKKCEMKYEMEYDLMNKVNEITRFFEEEIDSMHDRAPSCWTNPNLPNCSLCNEEKCVMPVTSQEDTKINWLFLFLGQFLGCLKLRQLKYFCTQTNIHRTGAKNRLLYLSYRTLFRQLQPFTNTQQ
ncbi:uncharacterized protein LOC103501397 [Cucumis melo]|uniref:Uncharacterized protein LOC103501397 n=1 Tax=Cucumis melo TaxID=3656 RepID=A0A1S3CK70_CUCME|nr:uncharacterized protein LOC103501397 [Cucumis melo]